MGVLPPILFWPVAAVLASLCAMLVLWFGARASRLAAAAGEDPARAVYRRQLADLDGMVEEGLLGPEEYEAARAEAARRLLAEAPLKQERSGSRLWPLAVAGVGALAALGLYVWLGAPGAADQPYRARLERWRTTPINELAPDQMAAVLREVARTKSDDPRLYVLLGRVEMSANDPVAAAQYLTKATRLEPANADTFAALGQALAAASGDKANPDAEAALNHALQLDPHNQAALFFLAGLRASGGDRPAAAGLLHRLAGELPDNDPRKAQVVALAQQAEAGPSAAAVPGPESAPDQARAIASAPAAEQAGFIRGMVATLQARLDASPDDPAGWARLVRSYRVLGDQAAEAKALAKARSLFKSRPNDLAPIEAAAK